MHRNPLVLISALSLSGLLFIAPAYLASQSLTAKKAGGGIEVSENGRKVLFYQQQPLSREGKYERAGYIHPLYSLNGNVMTEDFPEDHPFHRGIFWAWHQVVWKGRQVADGWICDNIFWKPLQLDVATNRDQLIIGAGMLWKTLLQNDTLAIINEETTITVHRSAGQYRAIDFDIWLYPLVDSLELGGSDDIKGYGGFCTRIKLPADIDFVSGDSSVSPVETAVTAGPWMNFTGSFDGPGLPISGLAIFCHPGNPGNGQQWILRKAASMQNLPFPGRKPLPLQKEGWRMRYRIIVQSGALQPGLLQDLYLQYLQKDR